MNFAKLLHRQRMSCVGEPGKARAVKLWLDSIAIAVDNATSDNERHIKSEKPRLAAKPKWACTETQQPKYIIVLRLYSKFTISSL